MTKRILNHSITQAGLAIHAACSRNSRPKGNSRKRSFQFTFSFAGLDKRGGAWYNKIMKNYTYFSISGKFVPSVLAGRIGVEPEAVILAGEELPSGEIATATTLIYGVNGEAKKPLTDRMLSSVARLLEKEELLGKLKTELGLTYYLAVGDFKKDEGLIVPFPVARFLYLSGTFRDLDYHTF